MKPHTRCAVAYIVGRLIEGKDGTSVYDYSANKHFSFSGGVSSRDVSVYDYEQGCHVGGSISSLYHYGNSKHLSLEIRGRDFTGYDYDTQQHYSGSVSGGSVTLYDYDGGAYFNYAI